MVLNYCGVLTLADCQVPIQLLSHYPHCLPDRMKKLVGLLASYDQRQTRPDLGKINSMY